MITPDPYGSLPLNQRVQGSSPCAPTIENPESKEIQIRFITAARRHLNLRTRTEPAGQKFWRAACQAKLAARTRIGPGRRWLIEWS
jgi:hypothetical protein